MMSHDEMVDVILAHKAGKTIQSKSTGAGLGWLDLDEPYFNFGTVTYRIKPEPREWVVEVFGESRNIGRTWSIHDPMPHHPAKGCKFVRVREVLE